MTKVKLDSHDIESWLIFTAVQSEKMEEFLNIKNDDDNYLVSFSINGVELDFSLVAKSIERQLDDLIESKAQEIIDEKYGEPMKNLYEKAIEDLIEIQEKIEHHKKELYNFGLED